MNGPATILGRDAPPPGSVAGALEGVRADIAVDFFRPAVRDSVILPSAGGDWRLLQDEQIISAPASALAHADTQ